MTDAGAEPAPADSPPAAGSDEDPAPPRGAGSRTPKPHRRPGSSLRDFLTDGALVAMCERLASLSGIHVEVRDESGGLIERVPPGARAPSEAASPEDPDDERPDRFSLRRVPETRDTSRPLPWRVTPVHRAPPIPQSASRFPLKVEGRVIGELIVHAEGLEPRDASTARGTADPDLELGPDAGNMEARRERLVGVVSLLATTASELCGDVLQLRHRVDELAVLYRLTNLLAAGSGSVVETLNATLRSALDVFNLDAGSIVLFPEDATAMPRVDDERELRMAASIGLSESWTGDPRPLSRNRTYDARALAGEVVAIADLAADADVLDKSRLATERLRAFFSAAMAFRGRPLGVIRLYSRTPRGFDEAEKRLLRSIGEQAAAAVQQARLLEIQKEERRMEQQLRVAAAVQHRMLPRSLPTVPGVDIAARSVPSYELGGDFYDIFTPEGSPGVPSHDDGDGPPIAAGRGEPHHLAMAIGDVVGKGVPAALLMASLRASLRAVARRAGPMATVLSRVNQDLVRDTTETEFATLWYGVYEPDARTLAYASAGHEPPFIVRCCEGRRPTIDDVHPLAIGGLVLGVDPAFEYSASSAALDPGDTLVAFTDGIPDARDFENHRYGFSRLAESIIEYLGDEPRASARAILDHAVWSVRRFVGLRRQTDDETLIVMRVR